MGGAEFAGCGGRRRRGAQLCRHCCGRLDCRLIGRHCRCRAARHYAEHGQSAALGVRRSCALQRLRVRVGELAPGLALLLVY